MRNEQFDIEFSKIIEKTKIKGFVTLSIDPVDYLLMSLNRSGWSSCHTLHREEEGSRSWGCYSAGTMSYMCDRATLIGFRHSGTLYDYKINKVKFKEYSKNWREVIYYDNKTHAFIASRQYPYSDENISKELRTMFEEILSNKFGFENRWKVINSGIGKYIDDCQELHYNDMLNDYSGKMCYPQAENLDTVCFDCIGSSPICPICGENDLDEANKPFCSYCDDGEDDYDD